MDPAEKTEQLIRYKLKLKLTQAWVASHQDVETEMDPDDPLDDVPILEAPRRLYSSMRSREFGSAIDEVTPGIYRLSGQWWSCEHVRDDPFEDEDDVNSNPGEEVTPPTNVPRCCRKCFDTGAFDKKHFGILTAGMKTSSVQNAENIESDSKSDNFGIQASDQRKNAQGTSSRSEIPSETSAPLPGSEDKVIPDSTHSSEYHSDGQKDDLKASSSKKIKGSSQATASPSGSQGTTITDSVHQLESDRPGLYETGAHIAKRYMYRVYGLKSN